MSTNTQEWLNNLRDTIYPIVNLGQYLIVYYTQIHFADNANLLRTPFSGCCWDGACAVLLATIHNFILAIISYITF